MKRYDLSVDPDDLAKTMFTRCKSCAMDMGIFQKIYPDTRYLRTGKGVSAETIVNIADQLCCSIAYLMGMTDIMGTPGVYFLREREGMLRAFKCRLSILSNEKKQREHLFFGDMAADMEIDNSSLVGYRAGLSLPKTTNLMRIAMYFNVSPDYLLGLTDEKGVAK